MIQTPRNWRDALSYAYHQARHMDPPAQYGSTWHNDCQAFAHECYGVGGGFGSAYLQWLGADEEHKHRTSDLSSAPLGALLCSKGPNPAGHIWLGARHTSAGVPGSWSPDFDPNVFGGISKVSRNAPRDLWGHSNLGWITTVNGYALDLTHSHQPAKPLQNKRYERLAKAISNLEGAHEVAVSTRDTHDAEIIHKEIERLKALYGKIRHS